MSRERAILDLALALDLVTVAKHQWLVQEIGASEETTSLDDKPSWNKTRRELSYRGMVVRKVKNLGIAKNVVLVLDVFQEEGWPERIDDPMPGGKNSRRLRYTISSLNERLDSIRFSADGSGAGILWSPL